METYILKIGMIFETIIVQGVPIENCQTEIALVLKQCMSDPKL